MRGFALRPVAVVVLLKTALELAFADRYGWHRDTLYYAVAGRHLQGGYVEFPPVTALISALAHALYGWSLLGFRSFPVLAGAGTVVVAALVARDLGANRRAQTFAAIGVAFAPGVLATNDLFQPVAFDQLTTMLVLWLALRLALGRGSWVLLGIAAGVGLETKYSLAVVLVLLIATFAVWRRDVLRSWGFPLAIAIAALLLVPNLIWEAGHGWVSVHWFLNPPPSGSDETRRAVRRQRDPADARRRVPGGDLAVSCRSCAIASCGRSAGRSSGRSSRTSCSAASRTTGCRRCCSRSRPARSRSSGGRRGGGCGRSASRTSLSACCCCRSHCRCCR